MIETQHLLLRPYTMADLEDFHAMVGDAEVVRFEPYAPQNLEGARRMLQERIACGEFLAVAHKADGRVIGNIYLGRRPFDALEIGYVFARAYWGRGYATQACRAAVEWAFAQGAHRIYAECDPCNAASWRLLERLGFAREGRLRQNVFFQNDAQGKPVWQDTYVYGLLREE